MERAPWERLPDIDSRFSTLIFDNIPHGIIESLPSLDVVLDRSLLARARQARPPSSPRGPAGKPPF